MGAFASKPSKRDFSPPVRSGKTPAIRQDSLENLAGRLDTINTQAGQGAVGGSVPTAGGTLSLPTTGTTEDERIKFIDSDIESGSDLAKFASRGAGLNTNEAILSGGSIGGSLDDTGHFLANPAGEALGLSTEETLKILGDPAGELGLAPKAIDQLSALLGITGSEAALEGARLQSEVANLGIGQVEAARERARQDLLPFQQLGLDQIPAIGQSLRDLEGIQAPELLRTGDQKALSAITGELGRQGTESLQSQAQAGLAQGLADEQTLRSEAFQGGLNPNILGSEFNQALMQNIQGQIDPRFAGAVGQEAQLQSRNLAQQDLQNRLSQNNQRFSQLQAGMQRGQQARQQQFSQTGQGFSTAIQGVGQQFNQTGTAQDLANKVAQQRFANQLSSQQQDFGQRGQLLAGGQSAATGQAAAGQASGQSIADLLTQQGNALAAGGVGSAQAFAQGGQNVANVGSKVLDFIF